MFLLPGRQRTLTELAAVREQAGALVATIGDHGGGLRCWVHPGVGGAVVAGARQRPTDGQHQAGVGVDEELPVDRVPVVLRRRGDLAVLGWDQGAVHDQHLAGAGPGPTPGTNRAGR